MNEKNYCNFSLYHLNAIKTNFYVICCMFSMCIEHYGEVPVKMLR